MNELATITGHSHIVSTLLHYWWIFVISGGGIGGLLDIFDGFLSWPFRILGWGLSFFITEDDEEEREEDFF